MNESHDATLTFWPATPLPAGVVHQLRELGVDLSTFKVNDGWITAQQTAERTVVLELSFGDCRHGLTDLEAVLATLRLADISYVAWDVKKGEIAGTGRSFDPTARPEREFTVMGDGEPVLTASDLQEFGGRYDTAGGLIEGIQAWLRLPIPQDLSELSADELAIVIVPDEDEQDEPGETVDEVDGLSDARLRQELLALGEAIRHERNRRSLSVDALARTVRVETSRLLAVEAGELDPDYDLLIALAEALDIRPSRFVTRAEAQGNPGAQR